MGTCCVGCCGGEVPPNPEWVGVWQSDDGKATMYITANGTVNYRTTDGEHTEGSISSWNVKQTAEGGWAFRVVRCGWSCECCGYEELDCSKAPVKDTGQFQRDVSGQYKAREAWRMIVNGHRFIRES